MEVSAAITLTTPGGTITFNSGAFGSGSTFYLTRLDGFDDPELRVAIDKKAREDGAKVHAVYAAAIHGTVEGWVYTNVASTRNSSVAALRTALASIRTADGTLSVTETGQAAKTLTVRQDGPLQTSIVQGPIHSFQFGLVGPAGVWS